MANADDGTIESWAGRPEGAEVAVLGAGVMGAAIAAHLANAGCRALLLDIAGKDTTPGGRQRAKPADDGLARARAAKPASFFSPRFESAVRTGTLDDDLAAAARCRFIIEAVVENLAIKQNLYARLEALGGDAVIASNTSGLPLRDLIAGRSPAFRKRFCITHFFNPPRYLKLVEIVGGPDTAPETLTAAEDLCGRVLGKGLVRAKDTPNFIGNRIGVFSMLRTVAVALEEGYTVEEVDMVFGPTTGRPKSAVFRTADLVGLDTLAHVAKNCWDALPNDERRDVFKLSPTIESLVANKWLGAKTGQGFYKKTGDAILQLDLKTLTYGPQQKPRFASIGAARGIDDVEERLRRITAGDDRAAALARKVLFETLIYAANRMGEIADDVVAIDRAMRWGFGWERGPFEIWDALGVKETAGKMKAAGLTVPPWVEARLAAGDDRFYKASSPGRATQVIPSGGYKPVPAEKPGMIVLDALRAEGREVERNASASVIDVGDGVLCLEFHSKLNSIDPDIVTMMGTAVDRAERDGVALIIGNDDPEKFCAGANLFSLLVALGQNNYDAVNQMVCNFQDACMRLRYARVPVVAAPFGLALGGGAEIVLACPAVRAHAELYVGCVEVGVGLIPGGGGTMELAARTGAKAPDDPGFDLIPLLRPVFEMLGTARVSTSAEEARDIGYLRATDGVSMARETLLGEAKALALGLARAGHRPPPPRRFRVAGAASVASMQAALRNLALVHRISEHDQKVVGQVARVLSGGDVPSGSVVDEQHLLDLEREAFLSLCGEEKTRARIQHMLTAGKPLRN